MGGVQDRTRAKRALGQNFLIDPNLQRKIVGELNARSDDVVLEVGPGHGELSQHIVGTVERLVLVEKDHVLAAGLRERWAERDDVQVLDGDALEIDLRALVPGDAPLRVISNVPYNITSPLLFSFLGLQPAAERIVLTVQREVAERIVSPPGNRTYGALSIGVQAIADVGISFRVPRQAFRPVPDVESAVVRIDPDPTRLGEIDTDALRDLTRECFNRRRKQLQKILKTAPALEFEGDPAEFLSALDIDPRQRPESLSAATFVSLAAALRAHRSETGPA